MQLVDWISLSVGIRNDDYTLKLAVFHTIFNLVGIIVTLPFINVMVKMLMTLLTEKEPPIEQPKYLTKSALDFPETAVKAVRMETLHLYENTIQIIGEVIGFSKAEIDSSINLEERIKTKTRLLSIDIDARYIKSIKGIYSAIIVFISKAKFNWEMEQAGDMHRLRRSNIELVETIKATKHLQKNLLKYSQSENPYSRKQYQDMRLSLVLLIRELEEIKFEADPDLKLLVIDSLKVSIKKTESQINKDIDELIRKGKITPEAGTSMINDSFYLFEIKNRLVRFFETLFASPRRATAQAERKLSLDDEEIIQIRDDKKNNDVN